MSDGDDREATKRVAGGAMLLVGASVALVQGAALDGSLAIPDFLDTFLQLMAVVAPLLLIRRGARLLLRESAVSRVVRDRVMLPLARWFVRRRGHTVDPEAIVVQDAPTEMLLDRAAESILARLPAAAQQELHALPAAIDALAAQAQSLRAADARLAAQERRAMNDGNGAAASLGDERRRVQGRLSTVIAALEAVRLDLLRFEQGDVTVEGLTIHLDAVREFGREVDARREVDELLRERDVTPV